MKLYETEIKIPLKSIVKILKLYLILIKTSSDVCK